MLVSPMKSATQPSSWPPGLHASVDSAFRLPQTYYKLQPSSFRGLPRSLCTSPIEICLQPPCNQPHAHSLKNNGGCASRRLGAIRIVHPVSVVKGSYFHGFAASLAFAKKRTFLFSATYSLFSQNTRLGYLPNKRLNRINNLQPLSFEIFQRDPSLRNARRTPAVLLWLALNRVHSNQKPNPNPDPSGTRFARIPSRRYPHPGHQRCFSRHPRRRISGSAL